MNKEYKDNLKLQLYLLKVEFDRMEEEEKFLEGEELTRHLLKECDILDKIKEAKRKTILIINKIDLVKREKLLNLIDIIK